MTDKNQDAPTALQLANARRAASWSRRRRRHVAWARAQAAAAHRNG